MANGGRKRKAKILVVEDNPADVELLRLALEEADVDCDLTVIADGAEVLAYLRQEGNSAGATIPDLAIIDVNLPKYDGIEILEAMRANRAFDGVPVVVVSSSSWPRERGKMQSLGVTSYITKPADLEEYLGIGRMLRDLLRERT